MTARTQNPRFGEMASHSAPASPVLLPERVPARCKHLLARRRPRRRPSAARDARQRAPRQRAGTMSGLAARLHAWPTPALRHTPVPSQTSWMRGKGLKVHHGGFRLDGRTNSFTEKALERWKRLPREKVELPSLQVLKRRADVLRRDMV